MKKINIAIDGPAGSGKTTIGKLLAEKLGCQFLDSGLLYRYFARFCQINNLSKGQEREIRKIFPLWQKSIEDKEDLVFLLERERNALSSPEISDLASQLAPIPELRQIILEFQRDLTKNKGWIVVGRDITSEVLPNAEIKIFLTASLATRIKRRCKQYQKKEANWQEVKKELQDRDQRDEKRKNSPLKKTADSWELDTTNLSPTKSVEEILLFIKLNKDKKIK